MIYERFKVFTVMYLMITAVFMGMMAGVGYVSAEIPEDQGVRQVGDDNSTNKTESLFTGLLERIVGFLGDVVEVFVDVITAPFKALAGIFNEWKESVWGDWWGPILATFVIIVVWLMIRSAVKVDQRFFKGN